MCITERLKTYATNSCEPADTLISAAQAACYDSIQDAVKQNSVQKNEPLHDSARVMDLTLQKLQGRYRQAVIEFRIFAKRDCKG